MMDVTVEIHCGRCGSGNYSLPAGSVAGATVRCNDCAAELGTVEQLQAELLDRALAHSAEALRRELDELRPDDAA